MKLGYSNLLGEYLNAESLEYKDCERFQVVCPACREPVFKVAGHRLDNLVAYLSHYRRDVSYDSDCELRVSHIGASEIEKVNYQSRGQRLQYFMSVFREIVLTNEYEKNKRTNINTLFEQMNRSKALFLLRERIYEICIMTLGMNTPKEHFEGFCEDYVTDIMEVANGNFYDTSFSIQVQKRIARDIWLHLLSQTGKQNWFFLFNHSYTFFISRIKIASKTREVYQWELFLIDRMEKLIRKNRQHGIEIIFENDLFQWVHHSRVKVIAL